MANSVDPDELACYELSHQDLCLFVLRFYGPVNPMSMSSAVSLPNHTFTGQA